MQIEILIVSLLIILVIIVNNKSELKKFVVGDDSAAGVIKEKDYDFLVLAKYGETADSKILYSKRIQYAGFTMLFVLILYINTLTAFNILKIILSGLIMYKLPYISLKKNYKQYVGKIDQMLPFYLKSLEILCQNYTVPVALSKSIDDAPEIFKPGLREMISKIDAGDSSIKPYMDFAVKYPVKDSMRMMRLLYRLGLGAQENKHQQLIIFSKSVSSLQIKAREIKYKSRLNWMEKRTVLMLVITGGGMLLVLMFSMLFMM